MGKNGEWLLDTKNISIGYNAETGNVTSFSANLYTKNRGGKLIPTGILVTSAAVMGENGKMQSDGAWMSQEYSNESIQVENNNN